VRRTMPCPSRLPSTYRHGSGPALPCRDIRSLFGVNGFNGTAVGGQSAQTWVASPHRRDAFHASGRVKGHAERDRVSDAEGALDLVGSVKTILAEGMLAATSSVTAPVRGGQVTGGKAVASW
jgi:hypothetical protein